MTYTGQWIYSSVELPPPYEEVLGCIGDEDGFCYMLGWYDPHTFWDIPYFENGEGPGVHMKHLLLWMRIPTPRGFKRENLQSQAPEWKPREQEEAHQAHLQYVKEETFGTTPSPEVVKCGIVQIDESDLVVRRWRICYQVRKPGSEQDPQLLTYLLETADRPILSADIQKLSEALSKEWDEYRRRGCVIEPNRIEDLGCWKNGRLLKEEAQR